MADNIIENVKTLPTAIDVAKLRVGFGSGRAEELAKLAKSANEWGVFLITNHGIPDDVLHNVEHVARGFFGMSVEERKASLGSYMNKDNKADGRNSMKPEDQAAMWVDRLVIKTASKETTDPWPQTPTSFRQVMEKYMEEATKVCDELFQALAEALSLERHLFLQNFEPNRGSELTVKVNYYAPCPNPDQFIGLPPHTDGSGLTLLTQFGAAGGLQVLKDGKWITVSWPSDALVVNVGEFLEILSNGKLTSCWHRVVPPTGVERISIGLFYNPPPRAEIGPVYLPNEVKWGNEKVYLKVVAEEYLRYLYATRSTSVVTNKA